MTLKFFFVFVSYLISYYILQQQKFIKYWLILEYNFVILINCLPNCLGQVTNRYNSNEVKSRS